MFEKSVKKVSFYNFASEASFESSEFLRQNPIFVSYGAKIQKCKLEKYFEIWDFWAIFKHCVIDILTFHFD